MTTQSDATHTDASLETKQDSITVDGAAALFLKRITDAKKPPADAKQDKDETTDKGDDAEENQQPANEQTDDQSDEQAGSTDADKGEGDKDKGDEKVTYADDNAKVKYTVDGKDYEVSVKDVKRLAGQEKALTQRSMEVAAAQKQWKEENERNTTALKKLGERAYSRFEPYSKIDWALMANQLSKEDYKALREDAADAEKDIRFIAEELDAQMQEGSKKKATELSEAGKACSASINDPKSPNHIPGWSKPVYERLVSFAINAGINPDLANTITDPALYKVLHDAQAFRDAKAEAKAVVTKAKNKVVSSKTLQPAANSDGPASPRDKSAMQRLHQTGSTDDAAAVFEARLKANRK